MTTMARRTAADTYVMLENAVEYFEARMMLAPGDEWRVWADKIDEARQIMQALLLAEEAGGE